MFTDCGQNSDSLQRFWQILHNWFQPRVEMLDRFLQREGGMEGMGHFALRCSQTLLRLNWYLLCVIVGLQGDALSCLLPAPFTAEQNELWPSQTHPDVFWAFFNLVGRRIAVSCYATSLFLLLWLQSLAFSVQKFQIVQGWRWSHISALELHWRFCFVHVQL